jgi:hypothetical protein
MPRYTRTKSMRKHDANARRAWQKRVRRIRSELRTEWRSGQVKPADLISVIRTAEQSHLRLKRLRAQRRVERQQWREASRQRRLRQKWMAA